MMGIGLVVSNTAALVQRPLAAMVKNSMVGGSSMLKPLDGFSFAIVCRCFLDSGCNGNNCS